MPKKNKENKTPNIYTEMNLPRQEVEDTLPMEEKSYEESLPKLPHYFPFGLY